MTQLTLQCRCGKQYKVPDTARGKKVKCSVCQHSFVVPLAADTKPVATTPLESNWIPAPEAPSDGLAAFFGENLGAGLPAVAPITAAPSQPIPEKKQIEMERAQIDAELVELKEQMKEEFMVGHAIIQARGRLNQRMEEARANAAAESRPVAGSRFITAIGFFVGGIGGVFFAAFLRCIWPRRGAEVSFGKVETAGLNAAAQYGRRRAVSVQARSAALETLLGKEIPWTARMTAVWGSSLCAVVVSLCLLVLALFMNWIQPILGLIFLGVVLFGWTFVGRELMPLNDAIEDYPQVAARIGRRRVKRLTSVLAVLMFLLLFGASSAWVGWTTYDWGRSLFEPAVAEKPKPKGSDLADAKKGADPSAGDPKADPAAPSSQISGATTNGSASSGQSSADKKQDSRLTSTPVPNGAATVASSLPGQAGDSRSGNSTPAATNDSPASETPVPAAIQPPLPAGTPDGLPSSKPSMVKSKSNASVPTQPVIDSSYMESVTWTRMTAFIIPRFSIEFPQKNLLTNRWGAVGKKAISVNTMWCVVGPIDNEIRRRSSLSDMLTGDPVKTLELAAVECEYATVIKSTSTAARTALDEWLTSNSGDLGPQSKVDIRGAFARDYSVNLSNGNLASIRIIVKGKFVYFLSAVYPDKTWERYAKQFLESFRLVETNVRP